MKYNRVASAKRALAWGANPNARLSNGFTALTLNHTHSDSACAAMARELLDWGADPDLSNLDGMSPLHYGAQFALPLLCSILMERGAQPEALDATGLTPAARLRKFHDQTQFHANHEVGKVEALFERQSISNASSEASTPVRKPSRL